MYLIIQAIENGELKESYIEYIKAINCFGSSLCLNNKSVSTINRNRIHSITVHREHIFECIWPAKRKIRKWLNEN